MERDEKMISDKEENKSIEETRQENKKENKYIVIKISCISKELPTENTYFGRNYGRELEIKKVHSSDEK